MIGFLLADRWRALSLALGAVCLVLSAWIFGLPVLGGGLIARLDRMTALNASNVAAHRQTKQVFRNAMAEARLLDQARLARVRAEQERINDHALEDYDRRMADLRARYDRLRGQGGAGAASSAGAKPMPGIPAPAAGSDEAASADGLSLAERYECSATALQLDELISWVERQADVLPN
ncbi:hypothetical protein [Novosphingobium olei]|uniref:hypothetical protein n=1 Tax=Novosphingobium olei TaxID=2728851 RepID=UPI0030870A35|nr:hypothetical protein NSDW_32820 [Novosphingobium olei]